MFYTQEEVLKVYQELGVASGDTIYVTGNFGALGIIKGYSKEDIFNCHLSALQQLIGETGTLVVPTHTFSLCNSDTPFSLTDTESETGAFTEFIRRKKDAVRQLHPFSSSTALGYKANYICTNNSKHVYGKHSPFDRMLSCSAKFVSVGMPASKIVSLVHHAEFIMGVPYRYSKEFIHPMKYGNDIRYEAFYLSVLYREIDVDRDKNEKIFNYFKESYELKCEPLGLSHIELFDMNEFIDSTTRLMCSDIYAWLKEAPTNRPFQT